MFARLVYESFRRQKRRKLLAGIAVALGVCVATAMIGVATDVGDKINSELRRYHANLVVTPQEDTLDLEVGGINLKPPSDGAFLDEQDIPRMKSIFWGHNILTFAPMLPVKLALDGKFPDVTLLGTYFSKPLSYGKEQYVAGVRNMNAWWRVTGNWPSDDSQNVLLGQRLASKLGKKPGDGIHIAGSPHLVSGILSTGGDEDDQIVAPLIMAQQMIGRTGAIRRIYVSALTKPEDSFARRDPRSMSPEMYDRWFCSPYAASITYQLQMAIPHSHVAQIRQVEQTEGIVLSRIKGLMLLVTLAALLASALGVSAAMATAIFERRREVGLMKALGAGDAAVAALFFAEATLLALVGGALGFVGGSILAREIGMSIFGSQMTVQPVLLPVILAIAVLVTFGGSAAAIRRAMRLDPVHALRGEA
jgi:putative ABC transport system permease protein